MSSRVFVFVVAACLAVTRVADAEDRGLVVLLGATEGDPVVLKISDELRVLGFDLEVAPRRADRVRVRQRATSGDAVAVVVVDEREIEVRVVAAGQVHERHVQRRAADPSTGALEAVEIIRGYLVPVEQASSAAPPGSAAPSSAPPRQIEPRSFSVRLSGGFVSAGSFPALASVTLGGEKSFGRFAIGVAAVGTVPSSDGWGGGIDVGVRFAPLGYTRPVSFSVGVGALGLAVAYKEDAKKYTTDGTAVPYVGGVVRARITGSLFARLDGMFGVSIPSLGFKTKTGGDIQFGSSVTAASIGAEVSW